MKPTNISFFTDALVAIVGTGLFFAGLWLLCTLFWVVVAVGLGGVFLGIQSLVEHFPVLRPALDAILPVIGFCIGFCIHYWWLLLGLWIVGVNLYAYLVPDDR